MSSKLRELVADLISFPMPTVAAITGHACAAGLIFAFCHDYIVMRKDRGFLYMSETDIGLKIPAWFIAVISCKIGDAKVRRDVVLKAKKLKAKQALEKGAVELGEKLVKNGWNGQVYGENRKQLYREILDKLGVDETTDDVNNVAIATSKM
ncbi:hypothetical protein Godav_009846 [Gossypium davidsonii]|uniref:Uncharacterized protein n=1 Tax=Gossypium davidsonii TaxID=34287 RepID=A0A7J8SFZ3_GOSDV|nr:hypothetical protein [Gossypium davidsonii]